MLCNVLYQATPLCKVGAVIPTREEIDARPGEYDGIGTKNRWPNDYGGRVISVARGAGCEGTVRPLVREAVRYGFHLAWELGERPVDLDTRLVDRAFVEE